MLLKKTPKLESRKVAIRLSADNWMRLDRLTRQAKEAGHHTQLEEALSLALIRMLSRAERELAGIVGPKAGGNQSAPGA